MAKSIWWSVALPWGDTVQIGIVSPVRGGAATEDAVRLRLASGAVIEASMLSWSPDGPDARRVRIINLPRADFERLVASSEVRVEWDGRNRHLKLSGMASLDKVMGECIRDLQAEFPMAADVGGTDPIGNPAAVFDWRDYPQKAVRNEQQGSSSFALLVDETGKVVDCSITRTSGVASLDAQSCAIILRRARFTPAKDAAGKPRKGRLHSRVRWVLPD